MVILSDDKGSVYAYSKTEDVVIERGAGIGGVGGGALVDRDESKAAAIPWSLPDGDRTWLQLSLRKEDAEGGTN